MFWSDKRYHSWNHCLRQVFGQKVAKISLDAGFSCPNRHQGQGGCIYCSPRGSGDCAGSSKLSVAAQFEQVKSSLARKWPGVDKYIAYFQAYTNTLAPPSHLENLYRQALNQPGVVGLSISTRPDCLPPEVLDLLGELNRETWLWVELGLQSAHDQTLSFLNRGHSFADFAEAVEILHRLKIRVCGHIILGLPGETGQMMVETAQKLAGLKLEGIKIHALHIVRDTVLGQMWQQGRITPPGKEEYIGWVVDVLEVLPPEMVVQRLTGDSPRDILLAPTWILDKWTVLQGITKELQTRNTWQGKFYSSH